LSKITFHSLEDILKESSPNEITLEYTFIYLESVTLMRQNPICSFVAALMVASEEHSTSTVSTDWSAITGFRKYDIKSYYSNFVQLLNGKH
jgi:hypothetical protein